MEILGELTMAGHRFPIHQATFRHITDNGEGRSGWEFDVCTQPPIEEPANESERFLFSNGVRFYAEGDPIPLPDADDLTGSEVLIEEPFDPESGEVYFTLYVLEHEDVSHVRLQFLERRGAEYRIRVSAMAHHVFEQPTELAFECWISREPSASYGL